MSELGSTATHRTEDGLLILFELRIGPIGTLRENSRANAHLNILSGEKVARNLGANSFYYSFCNFSPRAPSYRC